MNSELEIETERKVYNYSLITAPCESCGQPNSIILMADQLHQCCSYCSAPLNSSSKISIVHGFVYVLSNKSMPGIVKIGCTERDIENRVKELSNATGVPTVFKIEAYFPTEDPIRDEKKVHQQFNNYRIEKKEFFEMDVQQAVEEMSHILKFVPIIVNQCITIKHKIRWLECKSCKSVWSMEYDVIPDEKCPQCGWHVAKRLKSPPNFKIQPISYL